MRASALCAFILLGAGIATADTPKQETEVGRVGLADQKPPPRAPTQWAQLATPTPAKHGTEFVMVGAQQGSFSRLRLDAAKGRTVVKSVRVMFSDGTSKDYKVATTLSDKGHSTQTVELGVTKPITQISVTTDRTTSGSYAVYGASGPAVGTVVGSR